MYLVELKPGMETIYSSVAELTEAVRKGEVTESARVFHRARSQWVPITAHPKFQEIVASLTSAPLRKQWTFLPAKPGEAALQILDNLLDEQVPQRDAAEAVLAVRDGVEDGAVGDAGIDNR